MSGTITVTALSDAEIKRQMKGTSGTLRDDRYPGVRFRFLTDRSKGSWFLIGGKKWEKVAGYPQLSCKKFLEILPELQAQRALNKPIVSVVGRMRTCGDILRWYRDRVAKDRSLTKKRKDNLRAMIDVQLLPRIADLKIADVDRNTIDEQLMWPLQAGLSVSYVHSCMRTLKMALTQAAKLDLLDSSPMESMKFTDFVKAKIKPKPAGLNMLDLSELLGQLVSTFYQNKTISMIALMMLAHGTRIGETRQARWRHICLQQKVWVLPAANTKTRSEHVIPLTDRMCEVLAIYRDSMGKRYSKDGPLFLQGYTDRAITEATSFAGFRKLSGGKWSSHDLRKLARTGWVELGVDYLIGEMLLNHGMSLMAETYINTSADELKLDALTRWHERLDERGLSALSIALEHKN